MDCYYWVCQVSAPVCCQESQAVWCVADYPAAVNGMAAVVRGHGVCATMETVAACKAACNYGCFAWPPLSGGRVMVAGCRGCAACIPSRKAGYQAACTCASMLVLRVC